MKAKKITWTKGLSENSQLGTIDNYMFCVIDFNTDTKKYTVRTFLKGTVQFYNGYKTIEKAKLSAKRKLKKHIEYLQDTLSIFATEE